MAAFPHFSDDFRSKMRVMHRITQRRDELLSQVSMLIPALIRLKS